MASSLSPSSQQQFCLRWNNHQSALVSVFDLLLQSEAFVDVTLAAEGLLLRAHKLVLSACSPYFQNVFATHPASSHPVIILKDVCSSDLRALVDYMYKGEAAVEEERLSGFLSLAESLKIRGLSEFCKNETPSPPQPQKISPESRGEPAMSNQEGLIVGGKRSSSPQPKMCSPHLKKRGKALRHPVLDNFEASSSTEVRLSEAKKEICDSPEPAEEKIHVLSLGVNMSGTCFDNQFHDKKKDAKTLRNSSPSPNGEPPVPVSLNPSSSSRSDVNVDLQPGTSTVANLHVHHGHEHHQPVEDATSKRPNKTIVGGVWRLGTRGDFDKRQLYLPHLIGKREDSSRRCLVCSVMNIRKGLLLQDVPVEAVPARARVFQHVPPRNDENYLKKRKEYIVDRVRR